MYFRHTGLTASAAAAFLSFGLISAVVAAPTEITEVVSPGGIKAWLVQEPSVPVISVEFIFTGGAALDPAGKEGLANMVSGLLDEGAGELDSLAYQTRLEDLAVRLRFNSGRDRFGGSFKTLTRNRDAAFEMLRLAINEPRFDSVPVERIRQQIIVGLTRELEDPGSIASRTWFETAFPDHVYGRPADGTIDSVRAITTDDLEQFVAQRFARDNLIIGVVGDITPEDLGPLLDRAFGGLPATATPVDVPDVVPPDDDRLTVVRKDIPQSVVFLGMRGIKRDDPDWYAAFVMNYVLGGGGLGSRLNDEVREKRGLAYSVYSYLLPLQHTGIYAGGVGTQNARVGESLDIFRSELRRLRDEGITAEELADAKTYLNGSFPLRLTSGAGIARLLVAIQRQNLGIDYIDRRPDYINAVTLDDIKRVAQRLLTPDNLLIVVVGDPEGIEQDG